VLRGILRVNGLAKAESDHIQLPQKWHQNHTRAIGDQHPIENMEHCTDRILTTIEYWDRAGEHNKIAHYKPCTPETANCALCPCPAPVLVCAHVCVPHGDVETVAIYGCTYAVSMHGPKC
jgi:hypothetical protein